MSITPLDGVEDRGLAWLLGRDVATISVDSDSGVGGGLDVVGESVEVDEVSDEESDVKMSFNQPSFRELRLRLRLRLDGEDEEVLMLRLERDEDEELSEELIEELSEIVVGDVSDDDSNDRVDRTSAWVKDSVD